MNNMNAQMAELPNWVQLWMNWMMFIFVLSIVFVWKHKGARWTLASIILSMPVAILVFHLSNTIHLLGIVHLLLWTPLLIYMVLKEIKSEGFKFQSPYGVWAILLTATIAISLLFDIRDIILVAMGQK
ncbi:MAG: hypothetical protein HKN08_03225 [Gammaproteobacteria bacterium]|nr:hypothetical protein [Gammaproteobacteria bacterium]